MAEPQKFGDFISWKPPNLEPILSDGIMYRGSKVILYGKYKSFKTMLGTRFSLVIASDSGNWLEFKTATGLSVLHLQLEIPHPMLQRRVKTMIAREPYANGDLPLWFWTEPYLKLDDKSGFEAVCRALEQTRAEVLVVDPIYKAMSGDVTNNNAVTKLLDQFDKLIKTYGISLLLISHSRKSSNNDDGREPAWGTDDLLGGSVFSNWADSIINVKRAGPGYIEVTFDVVRHSETELRPRTFKVEKDLSFTEIPDNLLTQLLPDR